MAEIKISPKGLNSIFQQWKKEYANFKIGWDYLVLTTNEKKNEQILSDLWDATKSTNICTTGVPEERRKKRGRKNIWRIGGIELNQTVIN